MGVVEGFERKALFNITRAVALVCVTVFLIGVVGAGLYAFSTWREAPAQIKVSAQEILDQIKPVVPAQGAGAAPGTAPAASQQAADSPLHGYRIPFALQPYVSGDNAQVLRSHMDQAPAEDRQAYLDEMGAAVSAAEQAHLDGVDAINAYMKTKADRYVEAAAKTAGKSDALKYAAGSVTAGLFLIALFSLVLVLLAIERNTRPSPAR